MAIITIKALSKTYRSGHAALHPIDLSVDKGEIFALLGPNGAGKTTMISIVCGTVTASGGEVLIDGHDIVRDYRAARAMIGLVPQEIALDIFMTVWNTVRLSRGMFGKTADPAYLERLLRDLSLWDKRDAKVIELSGGMKRRVMIAKALSHKPAILFLDEPTAGVDVTLRRDMWALVRRLKEEGTTIILTTHYIEEAEEMADRVGVIDKGRLLLVDDKAALMSKLGKRQLALTLDHPLAALPPELADWPLRLENGGTQLVYRFDTADGENRMPALIARLGELGIGYRDLDTSRSSLEDIFVELVEHRAA
jgi:ABC-2 type transport system ATP-binding protein